MKNTISVPDLERFNRLGFLKKKEILSDEHVDFLKKESAILLEGDAKSWSKYRQFARLGKWNPTLFAGADGPTILYDFLGQSEKLDAIIDELLGRDAVKEVLESRLGEDFRLWYAMIRRIEPNGSQLRLHQDLPNEVSIGILLTNTESMEGSTVFVAGSNRWPRVLQLIPFLNPKPLAKFLTPAIGVPGDVYLFDNATWHGRYPSRDSSCVSIFLSFIKKETGRKKRIAPEGLVRPELKHLTKVLSP